ncbi:MAG: thiolase family protein [Actinomycetota bacterium]
MTVRVNGVGMTPFRRHDAALRDLAVAAATEAIADASLRVSDIGFVLFSNSLQGLLEGQEAIRGQVALQELGLPAGVPIVNVESACASGASALHLGRRLAAGDETVLVVGAEKMHQGDKARILEALATAQDVTTARVGQGPNVFMEIYASVLRERINSNEVTLRQVAEVAAKNARHGSLNDRAQFQVVRTVEDVLSSPVVAEPLTRLMCSPVSDGAAAVVLSARRNGPRLAATALSGPGMATDFDVIAATTCTAFEEAGVEGGDLQVVEVHDATAVAEITAYEAIGLCPVGAGGKLAEEGATALGGRVPVNVSGGLISRGHPVGATGLAQIVELVLQLRGDAGQRQVPGARVALAENHGGAFGAVPAAVGITVLVA